VDKIRFKFDHKTVASEFGTSGSSGRPDTSQNTTHGHPGIDTSEAVACLVLPYSAQRPSSRVAQSCSSLEFNIAAQAVLRKLRFAAASFAHLPRACNGFTRNCVGPRWSRVSRDCVCGKKRFSISFCEEPCEFFRALAGHHDTHRASQDLRVEPDAAAIHIGHLKRNIGIERRDRRACMCHKPVFPGIASRGRKWLNLCSYLSPASSGRGPTWLISPLKTSRSCGSTPNEYLPNIRPGLVVLWSLVTLNNTLSRSFM